MWSLHEPLVQARPSSWSSGDAGRWERDGNEMLIIFNDWAPMFAFGINDEVTGEVSSHKFLLPRRRPIDLLIILEKAIFSGLRWRVWDISVLIRFKWMFHVAWPHVSRLKIIIFTRPTSDSQLLKYLIKEIVYLSKRLSADLWMWRRINQITASNAENVSEYLVQGSDTFWPMDFQDFSMTFQWLYQDLKPNFHDQTEISV